MQYVTSFFSYDQTAAALNVIAADILRGFPVTQIVAGEKKKGRTLQTWTRVFASLRRKRRPFSPTTRCPLSREPIAQAMVNDLGSDQAAASVIRRARQVILAYNQEIFSQVFTLSSRRSVRCNEQSSPRRHRRARVRSSKRLFPSSLRASSVRSSPPFNSRSPPTSGPLSPRASALLSTSSCAMLESTKKVHFFITIPSCEWA